MSRTALKLLDMLGLLQKGMPNIRLIANCGEEELSKILQYYYKARVVAFQQEVAAQRASRSRATSLMSSVSSRNAILPLLPSCVIHDRLYVDDPLASMGEPKIPDLAAQALGVASQNTINRAYLRNKLEYFAGLRRLIENGAISVLPLTAARTLPQGPMLLRFDEKGYVSQVPEGMLSFVRKRARVSPLRVDQAAGNLIRVEGETRRLPAIWVEFEGDEASVRGTFYLYGEMQQAEMIADEVMQFVTKYDPEKELSQEMYNTWIDQSINQTVGHRIKDVLSDMRVSEMLGATYVTESEFESQLCGFSASSSNSIPDAVRFLEANFDRLTIGTQDQVLRIREKHQKQLLVFRDALDAVAATASAEGDTAEAARRVFIREVVPAAQELNEGFGKTIAAFGKGVLMTAGTVAFGVATGTIAPLLPIAAYGAISGLAEAMPALRDYKASRKRPDFLWSKLVK